MPGRKLLIVRKRCRKVSIDGCTPTVFAGLLDRTGAGEATSGIGDKQVDGSELAFNLAARVLNLCKLRNIGNYSDHTTRCPFEFRCDTRERRLVPAVNCDLGTLTRKDFGYSGSDATRAPSNQCDLVLEYAHSISPRQWSVCDFTTQNMASA